MAAGPTAGDSTDQKAVDYAAAYDAAYPDQAGTASSVFAYNYYNAALAMIAGLEAVNGDLSDGHAAFREALSGLTIDGAYGQITLDENRNAITDNYVQQVVKTDDGYGVKTMPQPIEFRQPVHLVETMPVFIFGFPFGQKLAVDRGNPAITVGKAAVSSLRRDRNGELAMVQVDGDVNPGNSGGPMVDSRGLLIGVTVAKMDQTRIGFAVPTAEVQKLVRKRLPAIQ